MTIEELQKVKINKAVAYIVGLTFPLIKIIEFGEDRCLVGAINHNSNMINASQLAAHYNKVSRLLNNELSDYNVKIVSNKNETKNISSKEGFSILINIGDKSEKQCVDILTNIVSKFLDESEEIRKEFVKGCFDGRASWDTTYHLLPIDVDRDHPRQKLIAEVIKTTGIEVNINTRDEDHPKNDQIRIKKDYIKILYNEIGLYSTCRMEIIKKGIDSL